MASILIKRGLVCDGTGNPPAVKNILIQGNRIAQIGASSTARANLVIDAHDMVVAPGFVDINTDSDHYFTLFTDPLQEDFIRQGVTSIIGGNCGASLAPIANRSALQALRKWGNPGQINIDWHSVKDFLAALQRQPLGVNFGTLVGHSTIRRGMIGDQLRDLTERELVYAEHILSQSLEEGAFGLSTGLSYAHERRTAGRELEQLVRVVARHHRVYATHLRDSEQGVAESIQETLDLAEHTHANIEISHFQPRKKWREHYKECLSRIEKASATSFVHYDVYPFEYLALPIRTFLPTWVQDGGTEAMRAYIRTPAHESVLLQHLAHYEHAGILIGHIPDRALKVWEGKSIVEYASSNALPFAHAFIKLMRITNLDTVVFSPETDSELLDAFLTHGSAILASNAASFEGNRYKHARDRWAFPTFLERTVPHAALSLEAAIHKMTGAPAKKFGIARRGVLATGNFADITILKALKPVDVIVNGVCALRNGELQHAAAGTVLKPGN